MAIHDNPDDLIYETNDKGERVLVKSVPSNVRAFLRFSNTTGREVDIYWRDFRGNRVKYSGIPPGSYYDVNSYLTHPWEFRDAITDEVYCVNNKPFFRAPENTGGMMYRTNWNIHVGMRSLRDTALLTIASQISPDDVILLEIPRTLQDQILAVMGRTAREAAIEDDDS